MRPGIRGEERKSVTESLSQAGLEGVVAGVRDAGDLADRTVNATFRRVGQRASRIETTLIRIARGRQRTWPGRRRTALAGIIHAGDIGRRIPFNESRESH